MSVFSPSDLRGLRSGARLRVGGRARRQPDGSWQLADALDAVVVHSEATPADGCLVLVEGIWTGDKIDKSVVVEQHEPMSEAFAESARLLDRGVGVALRRRADVLRSIRMWFDKRGFLEVETPQRVPSPGLDLHLDAFDAAGAFLITSPEYQMKRLLAGGFPRIYQLVRCFRADERGELHNSEFLMLEWYRAFAGIDDVTRDTEELIAHVAQAATGEASVRWRGRTLDVRPPFARISVLEAFERHAGLDRDTVLRLASSDEDAYFRLLVEKVEPALAAMPHAVVLHDFPSVHASLARRRPDDPTVCERFEVYVGGVELCNGFGELTDAREQRMRLEHDRDARRAAGKVPYPIDERFVQSLEEGMPPSGGNALGVDRLVMLCLGADSIGQVMAFPDDWL